MGVMVKIAAAKGNEVYGTVVDMPTPNIFEIETSHGRVMVHESLITKFF